MSEKMILGHYSNNPESLKKISRFGGRFGSWLFFTEQYKGTVSIEIGRSEIIEASSFFYKEELNAYSVLEDEIKEIMEKFNIDEDQAMGLIDESIQLRDLDIDDEFGEISWDMQLFTAECAKKLGFRAVAIKDELGISYMIDMYKRENELIWNQSQS